MNELIFLWSLAGVEIIGWLSIYFFFSTIITLSLFIKCEKWKAKGITKDTATNWRKFVFFVAVCCDVTYNFTTGVFALSQFPRRGEYMFTYHLQRVVRALLIDTRWQRYRLYMSMTYCFVLNLFDLDHCKNNPPTI